MITRTLSRGFTLIELLIVISILGILATLVVVNLSGARKSARDAERIDNLKTIQTALESYFNDKGYYPPASCGWDCNGYSQSTQSNWNNLAQELARYLPQLPADPVNTGLNPWQSGNYAYAYGNVGRDSQPVGYDLIAQFETNNPDRCELRKFRWGFTKTETCNANGGGNSNLVYAISERLVDN